VTLAEPTEKYPVPAASERPEEFSPGLDPELDELAGALVEAKEKVKKVNKIPSSNGNKHSNN